MRRVLLFLLALAAVAPASASALAGPQSCIGAPARQPVSTYNETRQFVDFQTWWRSTPGKVGGSDFGHAHVGACIPERESMQGATIPLDIRLILHDNAARTNTQYPGLSIVLKGTSQETTIKKFNFPGWTCPDGTCERWVHYDLPQASFLKSGLQEIRFRFFVDEPDGNRMIASGNWQTYINNGMSRSDVTRNAYLRGKGWYTGAAYCETSLRSVPLPDTPITTATWLPTVAQVWHGTAADLPVTGHDNRYDADNHAGIPGTTLASGIGPFAAGPLSVPAGSMTAGVHKLNTRADCDDPRGSTNSGVMVVPFAVAGV